MNETKARKADDEKIDVPYLINLKRDQKPKMAFLKDKGYNIPALLRNLIDELHAKEAEKA